MSRFADFVTTPPLHGLGASVELIRRIVAGDPEALDLLDRAVQNPAHIHRSDVDISNVRPTGTTKDQALRRLRKDAPEQYEAVRRGEKTIHAAAGEGS